VNTPLGPVLMAATAQGLAGLWFDAQQHHPGELAAPVDARQPHLLHAARELAAYFAGRSPAFTVAMDPAGTVFQRAVWAALRRIPRGETRSYGDVARAAGKPEAVRAVGAAIGRNPISVIVPCHRVIGRDGSLTGYAGGLERKAWLLHLEGAAVRGLETPTSAERAAA
jgi:methylated-DNA-[protein]-cysteine S-methyltransferase